MKIFNLVYFSLLIICCYFSTSCKKQPLPNDDIRKLVSENVIQKDTIVLIDSLLTKLDKNNVKFCDYINYTHYQIQDSCDVVAAKKFPDLDLGVYTDEYLDFYHQIVSSAIKKYNDRLEITKDIENLATYIFVFYNNIKNYCNLRNVNTNGTDETTK